MAVWGALTVVLSIRAAWGVAMASAASVSVQVRPLRLDLNRASLEQLQLLPGVGGVRAEAIVLDRIRRGPFRSVADLQRVDGLGLATIEEVRPFVSAGDPPR